MAPYVYQIREPVEESRSCPTLLLLHGLGADEQDLIGLSAQLPTVRIVTLRAPYPYEIGFQWYRMSALGSPEPGMLDASQQYLDDFLERELPSGRDSGDLCLGGFSQGALMAAIYTLRTAGRGLRATVALSGYLPDGLTPSARLDGYPIFWGHGTEDEVLPWQMGAKAVEHLQSMGAEVRFHTYPMGHSICLEEMADLRGWLGEVCR